MAIMNTATKIGISENIREVIFPSTECKLAPPRLFQWVVKSTELPKTMRSNDVIFYRTRNAHAWFDGVNTIFLDENMDTLYKYGDVDANVAINAESTYLQGNTLFLGAAGANNYYHWMVDVIPKLKVLEVAGIDINSIDHFVLRDLDWSFQEKMLGILGIPKSKIHLVVSNPSVICENLYHIELRNFVGMRMHPFIPEYLRELFKE